MNHSPLDDIVTPRLALRLMQGAVIQDCLSGDLGSAGERLGIAIPEEFLEHRSSLETDRKQLETDPLYQPWSTRALILAEERKMVGYLRFHTRPDADYLGAYAPGAVEFGYCIFTGHRQRGYATEAAAAAMHWAQEHFGTSRFVTSVAPHNTASLKLIARLGFTIIGQQIDEEDGLEHVFLRDAGGLSAGLEPSR